MSGQAGPRAGHHEEFTAEPRWRSWLAGRAVASLDPGLSEVPPPGRRTRRVLCVAAHPDDEVLAVGGLVSRLHRAGHQVAFLTATLGEGSHPGSPTMGPEELALRRSEELDAALGALGLPRPAVRHLGLPDSGLARCPDRLRHALAGPVAEADLVLSPWEHDGHPDHDAVGRACAEVAGGDVVLWRYPVWAWHWVDPDRPAPVFATAAAGARRLVLTDEEAAAKRRAIACFATQVRPLSPHPADDAVLPPEVLAHFDRREELVFT